MLQCNSQNRRVMTNTNTHVHRWPGVTGESLVPIHWNPSIPRSSPKHDQVVYQEHTRTQQTKSTRRLAVRRLAWLGSTCIVFTTRPKPVVRNQTLPCTSVVPA